VSLGILYNIPTEFTIQWVRIKTGNKCVKPLQEQHELRKLKKYNYRTEGLHINEGIKQMPKPM